MKIRACKTEDLVRKHVEKAKVHNAFFISVLMVRQVFRNRSPLRSLWKFRAKVNLPSVEENQGIFKQSGQTRLDRDGMYVWVQRELANVIARPLSIVFEWSWWLGEVSEGWRKPNVIPTFKKDKKENPGNYRLFWWWPHLNSWERDGATNHGNDFQAPEEQEDQQE